MVRLDRKLLVLIALALVLAFGFQGSRGIYQPDEGYYVCVAQEMVASGDYLVPRLDHQPWLDKPPLSLWGIAAGLNLLGHNEWGARAFHGLCFALTILLVGLVGRALGRREEGLWAGLIYATMILPVAAADIATPDTPLTLWTSAAFLFFWKSVEPGARRVALWKMLMCAAFGLGFLTKGPAALIPSGAMFVYLLLRREALRYFLTPWIALGLLIFAALGLGWYAALAHEVPGALHYFWDNQVAGRTVSAKYARNPGSLGALIYLPVILLTTLPWSLLWWPALWRGRGQILRPGTWRALRDRPAGLLLALWIGVSWLVLCLASSKLPLYGLPIFPAMALATARLCAARARTSPLLARMWSFPSRASLLVLTWAAFMLGLKAVAAHYPHPQDMRALYSAMAPHLPREPYELVAVREHLEGLGFYDGEPLQRVTTSDTPYPFFTPPTPWKRKIEELRSGSGVQILLSRKEGRTRRLRAALERAGIGFEEVALPWRRHMFVCRGGGGS